MQYASDTLVHYFKMVWEEAGLQWNEDNESEVIDIVQSIENSIDFKLKHKTYPEETRQKIASEQLAALIVSQKTSYKLEPLVESAIQIADELLKQLADRPSD